MLVIEHKMKVQKLERSLQMFIDNPDDYHLENVIDDMYELQQICKRLYSEEDTLTEFDKTHFIGGSYGH